MSRRRIAGSTPAARPRGAALTRPTPYLLLALLLAAACDHTAGVATERRLSLCAPEITFDPAVAGRTSHAVACLEATGSEAVTILGLSFEAGSAFAVGPWPTHHVPVGARVEIPLVFTAPAEAGTYVDALRIRTDAANQPEAVALVYAVALPPPDCTDDLHCTLDAFDPVTETCTHTPDPARCDDDNRCTIDACDAERGCVHTLAPVVGCDDEDPCTTDGCNPDGGCTHEVVPDGTFCDDERVCTRNDVCRGGRCEGAAYTGVPELQGVLRRFGVDADRPPVHLDGDLLFTDADQVTYAEIVGDRVEARWTRVFFGPFLDAARVGPGHVTGRIDSFWHVLPLGPDRPGEALVPISDVNCPAARGRFVQRVMVGDQLWVAYDQGVCRADLSDPDRPGLLTSVHLETCDGWPFAPRPGVWTYGDGRHLWLHGERATCVLDGRTGAVVARAMPHPVSVARHDEVVFATEGDTLYHYQREGDRLVVRTRTSVPAGSRVFTTPRYLVLAHPGGVQLRRLFPPFEPVGALPMTGAREGVGSASVLLLQGPHAWPAQAWGVEDPAAPVRLWTGGAGTLGLGTTPGSTVHTATIDTAVLSIDDAAGSVALRPGPGHGALAALAQGPGGLYAWSEAAVGRFDLSRRGHPAIGEITSLANEVASLPVELPSGPAALPVFGYEGRRDALPGLRQLPLPGRIPLVDVSRPERPYAAGHLDLSGHVTPGADLAHGGDRVVLAATWGSRRETFDVYALPPPGAPLPREPASSTEIAPFSWSRQLRLSGDGRRLAYRYLTPTPYTAFYDLDDASSPRLITRAEVPLPTLWTHDDRVFIGLQVYRLDEDGLTPDRDLTAPGAQRVLWSEGSLVAVAAAAGVRFVDLAPDPPEVLHEVLWPSPVTHLEAVGDGYVLAADDAYLTVSGMCLP